MIAQQPAQAWMCRPLATVLFGPIGQLPFRLIRLFKWSKSYAPDHPTHWEAPFPLQALCAYVYTIRPCLGLHRVYYAYVKTTNFHYYYLTICTPH